MSPKRLKQLETVAELTDPTHDVGGISKIRRIKLRNHYDDGEISREYTIDVISHRGTDAVGVLPYWKQDGETHIMLLNSFRPAQSFRSVDPLDPPMLIEIIAGVIEAGEHNAAGVVRRAVAELEEEAGLVVDGADIRLLGGPIFSSPGIFTEKIWLCAVEVDPTKLKTPTLDGSVMEELLERFSIPLERARQMCLDGEIQDAKTELALERFARIIGG